MQPEAGELDAALVEEPDVEVGVEFRRTGIQLRHLFHAVGNARKLRGLHTEHGGKLIAPADEGAAVGLAFGEELEIEGAILLLHRGGDDFFHRAADGTRGYRRVDVLEGDVGGVGAVFAHEFGGEHTVFGLRLAEGIQKPFCVARRALHRDARLAAALFVAGGEEGAHAFQPQQFADVVEGFEFDRRQRHRAHIEEGEQRSRVLTQMFELHLIDVQDALAVAAPLVVVGEASDVAEGGLFDVAALLGAQGELGQDFEVVVERALGQFLVKEAVDVQAVGGVLVGEVVEDRLIEREAQIAFAVHRIQLFLQLFEGDGDLRRLFGKLLLRRALGEGEGGDDVVEHLRLVRLVGVQFQTEVAEPDVLQSAVDDGERRHLFCDEEHSAPAHYIVGDDVGDGLRFARPGRSVQHETLGKTVVDRGILRAVRRDGQIHPLFADIRLVAAAVGEVEGALGQFQTVVDEGAHDGVRAEAVALILDVVPQQIIGEREGGEEDVADKIPALETHRLTLYARQHRQHSLRSGEVGGGEPAHIEVELLIQKFQQSAVYAQVVGVDFHGVDGRRDALLAYRDGVEEEGGVLVVGKIRFLPFEKTRREIQREGARLLLNGLFLAEEAQERAFVLALVEDCAQSAVAVFIEDIVRKRFQESAAVEAVGQFVQTLEGLLRLAFHGVGADVRHVFHKVLDAGHEQFDHRLRHLEVEKGVAHVHVQQPSLPLRDAADLLFAADVAAVFLQLFGRKVGVVVLALTQVIAVFALDPLGQGEDVHDAGAFDVHDELRIRALFEQRLRALFRLFEGNAAEDVVHAHEADVANTALGLPAQQIRIVADGVGQALADEETPRIPLAVDEGDHGVLPVGFHHGGEDEGELEGSRRPRDEGVAVVGDVGVARVRLRLRAGELLIGKHAVTGGEMVAHVVARARVARAGGELPPLQFAGGEVHELVELRGAPDKGGKAAGVLGEVAFVEGEQLHGEALRRDERVVFVKHFQHDLAALSPVQRHHVEGGETDVGVELRRRAAGDLDAGHLEGQDEFRLGRDLYAQSLAIGVRGIFDIKTLDG